MASGLLLVLAVVVLSLLPVRELPNVNVSDKIEHAAAYLMLSLWFGGLLRVRAFLGLGLALLALGGGIELAQAGMGLGRQGDWRDMLANAVGVVAGLFLAAIPLGRWAHWLEHSLRPRPPSP
jgi:VanZ family protein